MAVGRVGGTKSRLSGQVGNEIYSAMRNPDGSYTQVVRAKAESVRYSNTTIQAAQRMVTGMVEGLMNRLAPVAKIAIQDAPNDAWAVNKFSSMNLKLVREDMKAHWYDSDHFSYPFKLKNPADYIQSGGYWRISEGTLKNNLFSVEGEDEYYYRWMKRPVDFYAMFYGLKWELTDNICTVGDFLRKYGITRRDLMCFVYWESDDIIHDPEEEPEHIEGYHYIIISVDPMILDSAPATEENLISLFHVTSDNPYIAQVSLPWVGGNPPADGLYSFFAIGRAVSTAVNQEEVGWCCGFSVSYATGKRQVSPSTLKLSFSNAGAVTWVNMDYSSWVDGMSVIGNIGEFPSYEINSNRGIYKFSIEGGKTYKVSGVLTWSLVVYLVTFIDNNGLIVGQALKGNIGVIDEWVDEPVIAPLNAVELWLNIQNNRPGVYFCKRPEPVPIPYQFRPPSMCFGSWVDMYWVRPFPSPFE